LGEVTLLNSSLLGDFCLCLIDHVNNVILKKNQYGKNLFLYFLPFGWVIAIFWGYFLVKFLNKLFKYIHYFKKLQTITNTTLGGA
jgi:hypothetical protein